MPSLAAVREPPFALTARASARVELALAGAFRKHDTALAELRSAIEACVGELQEQGCSRKRWSSRCALSCSIPRRTRLSSTRSRRAATLMMDEIIQWSILAYYPATLPLKPPRGRRGEGS